MQLQTILINYKTPEMTLESLAAFMREMGDRPGVFVTLVDNASHDGSVEKLSEEIRLRGWGDRVALVESERNGGFAYGVNVGVQNPPPAGRPDFIYLLNSDAFPDPRSIDVLLDFLTENPDIGIAGSYIYGSDGVPHVTAFRFPSLWSEFEGTMKLGLVSRVLSGRRVPIEPMPAENTRVDWLAGASMLIRVEVFEDVGIFDDAFFLYYEETDFCRRALNAGWETWYLPESRVVHIGSVSTGMKKLDRPMPQYWFDSRAHYLRKNHGLAYLALADLLWMVGFSIFRVRCVLQRKEDSGRPRMLRDFIRSIFSRSATPTRTK
ncbi:MAG: glycosyltransferase family 2 protein [Myxococcota bacterium]|nr:glycosyltransferase family 2 protein [Myxococcota bacterium]